MSVREFSPLFSWGFSFRRSKWLIPLFNNNIFSFGNSAVNDGPYGYKKRVVTSSNNRRQKSTNQKRGTHTMVKPKHANEEDEFESDKTFSFNVEESNTTTTTNTTNNNNFNNQASVQACEQVKKDAYTSSEQDFTKMSDGQVLDLLQNGTITHYSLEDKLKDNTRAVKLRRMFMASMINAEQDVLQTLPYSNDLNYDQVKGVCCESVVGYVPMPVGVVGPLTIDGKAYHIPMATVEGCLVASTHRGCKALSKSLEGGVRSVVLNDGMTRGPVVQMPNATECNELKQFIENETTYKQICDIFNSTSRFARLQEIKVGIAGRKAFLRFKCSTGDAMGMNMISKATDKVLCFLHEQFPRMDTLSVSGNYCTDKKPSAMNWLEGRGKSVVVDATIPKDVVEKVLKTTVDEITHLNVNKNLVGSAMAGSIGGFNAHASNIVTAIYIATGQDAAQNVESSNCMTLMEKTEDDDLYVSVTMPSIEVGTIGGGTHLDAQRSCLEMMGVAGSNAEKPGSNAQTLARCIASAVMAGELSLMSALAANHLIQSHMKLNRKK